MKDRPASLIRLLRPHAKPYAGALVAVLLLGMATALFQQSAYLLLSPTWNLLFPSASIAAAEDDAEPAAEGGLDATLERWRDTARDWVIGSPERLQDDATRMELLWKVAAMIAILALLAGVAQYAFTMLSRRVGLELVMGLRVSIARHLMGLSLRYHSKRRFGDLLSRVSSDVQKTLRVVNIALRDLVQEPLMALSALGMAFLVSPEATAIVLIGLPILLVPVAILLRKIQKGSRKSLDELGASVQALSQMFQGVRTVKAFRAEERELDRYRGLNRRWVGATMKMVRAQALSRTWTILYTHAGLGVILLVVGWLAISGSIDDGGYLLAFFILISKAYTSIKVITRSVGKVAEARGACERLQALLDERPDVEDSPNAIDLGRNGAGLGDGIRFENVSFRYPGGEERAIEELNLHIRPGETLAVVGPSGAGKSTFLDLVARFVDPNEGRVTVRGADLRDVTIDSWSSHFAMVGQEPFLFHASIEENIRYGRWGATHEEVQAAAAAANIDEFVRSLPEGYGTDVADMGTRLSGGQRQRITLARAILHGGELLLLDEATSALDTESEAVVQAALDRMMEGRTVIVIAHRLSTIRGADRIAVLESGKLVELGTHDELLASDGLYARLHAMQFRD